MTTATVEAQANLDGAATADMNLKILLRWKVVPNFFRDVGYAAWRRGHSSSSLSAGSYELDLADNDFDHMIQVGISQDLERPLAYIGDNPTEVQVAKLAIANNETGTPSAYFLQYAGGSGTFRRLHFNVKADQAYTVYYSYHRQIPFADDTSSVELDGYMPRAFQWALVEGLRREIYERRYGKQDPRYEIATAEYNRIVGNAKQNLEMGRGRVVKTVR